jgi:hypothetical protein
MSTFSIKERLDDLSEEVADVSGATAFLLRGTDGIVAPLWEGTGAGLGWGAEGAALGLPTTVVAGATVRWTEAFVKDRVETWEEARGTSFLPLPLALTGATSFSMDWGAGISSSGSSSNSITSGVELTRVV